MLPERLSNGICSLNPNEDRLVLACEMEFDPSGRKTRHRVFEAVFRSHHRCVYETLQQYFERPKDSGHEYSPQVRDSLDACVAQTHGNALPSASGDYTWVDVSAGLAFGYSY